MSFATRAMQSRRMQAQNLVKIYEDFGREFMYGAQFTINYVMFLRSGMDDQIFLPDDIH